MAFTLLVAGAKAVVSPLFENPSLGDFEDVVSLHEMLFACDDFDPDRMRGERIHSCSAKDGRVVVLENEDRNAAIVEFLPATDDGRPGGTLPGLLRRHVPGLVDVLLGAYSVREPIVARSDGRYVSLRWVRRDGTARPKVSMGVSRYAPAEEEVAAVPAPSTRARTKTEGGFDAAVAALSRTLDCDRRSVRPAEHGMGPLFGCVSGRAEMAKTFVNGTPDGRGVLNVKVMWNDWHRDVGHGIHADRTEALRMLDAMARRYAPEFREELRRAFLGEGRRVLRGAKVSTMVEVRHGPSITERVATFSRRGT